MKLISMSVWGDQLMYWEGALANAQLHQSQYPGWKLRIYTDVENPITQKMRDMVVKFTSSNRYMTFPH